MVYRLSILTIYHSGLLGPGFKHYHTIDSFSVGLEVVSSHDTVSYVSGLTYEHFNSSIYTEKADTSVKRGLSGLLSVRDQRRPAHRVPLAVKVLQSSSPSSSAVNVTLYSMVEG